MTPRYTLCAVALATLCSSSAAVANSGLDVFGYFATRYEKTFAKPVFQNGKVETESTPGEFSNPFFHVMMQHQFNDQFKAYINLNGAGSGTIDVRNYWGEYSASEYFNIRAGKIYRKFGLYNEILDAVPTYYGIEPPEIFDNDHLLISRTTNLMLYGAIPAGPGRLNWALMTDNGEGGIFKDAIPLGWDLNYKIGADLTIGTSGYTSGGPTTSDTEFGAGSPRSGVLPWMDVDTFTVVGGYVEAIFGNLTLQGEYWTSSHKARRNLSAVQTLLSSANLNQAQRERFSQNRAVGDYTVNSWYFRAGYSIETGIGEIAPYVQWDYYSNPEVIADKTYGGDDEAGLADDGVFNKSTVGVVFRPNAQVAIKLDQSFHLYKFNGENVSPAEVRLDVSYTFGL